MDFTVNEAPRVLHVHRAVVCHHDYLGHLCVVQNAAEVNLKSQTHMSEQSLETAETMYFSVTTTSIVSTRVQHHLPHVSTYLLHLKGQIREENFAFQFHEILQKELQS